MLEIKLLKEINNTENSNQIIKIFDEILNILKWKQDDINTRVYIGLDKNLPEGGGRAAHEGNEHWIWLNPRSNKSFPWP